MEIHAYNIPLIAMTTWYDGDAEKAYRFFEKIGLARERIDNLDNHGDVETGERFWETLEQEAGSQHVGLILGKKLGVSFTGMLSYLHQVSPTLRVALNHSIQFQELYSQKENFSVFRNYDEGDLHTLEILHTDIIRQNYPKYDRHAIDSMLINSLHGSRELSRRLIKLAKVELSWPKTSDRAVYEGYFQAPVYFGCASNRIMWHKSDLDRPMVTHNEHLYRHFKETIEQVLSQKQAASVAAQVRALTLNRLNRYEPVTAESIASEMNLAVRSLQRKLESESTTLQKIVDEARKEVALQLIRKNTYNVNEIAYAMGYDEPSSFRRAFKKWTGVNPKAYASG